MFSGKQVQLEDEMVIVEVCKEMGWDYYTYMSQPIWMIETIMMRIRGEGRANKYLSMKYGK